MLKSLCVAAVLALGASPALAAAVVVSSKLSSESAMIGQMIRLLLKAHGIDSVDRTKIGATPVVRKALLSGEIDLYVEYTGNADRKSTRLNSSHITISYAVFCLKKKKKKKNTYSKS